MYIDSNIFIYSALDTGSLGDDCRQIVDEIENGSLSAASSFLVLDEVLWILQREMEKEDAVRITKKFLSLPLRWIDVKRDVMFQSLKMFEEEELDPRDSIHLASMKEAGLTSLLSEDGDFDDIQGIERSDAESWVERS